MNAKTRKAADEPSPKASALVMPRTVPALARSIASEVKPTQTYSQAGKMIFIGDLHSNLPVANPLPVLCVTGCADVGGMSSSQHKAGFRV